jgi:hypothetical protein
MKMLVGFMMFALVATASAQIKEWKIVANAQEVLKQFGDTNHIMTVNAPGSSVWGDERIVLSGSWSWMESTGVERTRAIVVESVDGGASWTKIGDFLGDYKYVPMLRYPSYTHGGNIVAYVLGKWLRYDRQTSAWIPTFMTSGEPLRVSAIRFRSGNPFYMWASVGDVVAYTSDDDGVTLTETIGDGQFDKVAFDDSTTFSAGRRQRPGWTHPDVQYSSDALRLQSPGDPFFAPALGMVFQGAAIGDDDARTWEVHRYQYIGDNRVVSIENGTFVAAGERLQGRKINQCAISTDMGWTWKAMDVDVRGHEVQPTPTVRCTSAYYTAIRNGDILRAVPADTMAQDLRWPLNAAIDRPSVQTIVCPTYMHGEVRLQIATNSDMSDLVLDTTTTARSIRFSAAEAFSTYHWRYQWRSTAGDPWSPWSSTWSWSTGSFTFFTYLGDNEPGSTTLPLATITVDGRIVRVFPRSRRVMLSTDGSRSYDSVASIPGKDPITTLWESPGGRIVVSTERETFNVDVINGIVTTTSSAALPITIGGSPTRIYGHSNGMAYMSTDDGVTWKKLGDLTTNVDGMTIDGDGNILYGCSYELSIAPPPNPSLYVGGLKRYNIGNGRLEQLAPNTLSTESRDAVTYTHLTRLKDGTLFIVDEIGKRSSRWLQSRDGLVWQIASDTVIPRPDVLHPVLTLNRNGDLCIGSTTKALMRRGKRETWERMTDGYRERKDTRTTRVYDGLRQARDGSYVLEGMWMMTDDESLRMLRPRPRVNVETGDVRFSWKPNPDALNYDLHITPEDQMLKVGPEASVLALVTQPGAYQWQVRPHLADGTIGSWSAPAAFVVNGTTGVTDRDHPTTQPRAQMRAFSRAAFMVWIGGNDAIVHDIYGRQISAEQAAHGLFTVNLLGSEYIVLLY